MRKFVKGIELGLGSASSTSSLASLFSRLEGGRLYSEGLIHEAMVANCKVFRSYERFGACA